MNKRLSVLLVTTLLIAIFIACTKDDNTSKNLPIKDYTAFIKNKTWWGTVTNDGETAQYYTVYFNPDGSLVWSQLSGDYAGKWAVDKNKLTINFSSTTAIVTAEISDDNKLINIITSTPNKVNSGELVVNPNISLENTVWNGTRIYILTDPPKPLQFTFMPNSKVSIKVNNILYGAGIYDYTRSSSGGNFRIPGTNHFGVIVSGSEMKGSEFTANRLWQVVKQ